MIFQESKLVVDASEKILWLNPAAEILIGYDRETLTGCPLSLLLGRGKAAAGIFDSVMPRSLTIRMSRQDDSRFLAGCFTGNINLPGGPGFTLVFSDVSEEKKRENELLLSAKVFKFSGEAIMITDAEDKILAVNPAFIKMTGYSADEVGGYRPDFLNSGRQDKHFYEKMWASVHRHGHWTGEVWNRLSNGGILPMWTAVSTVKNLAGELDHYVTFPGIVGKISRSLQQPFTINGDVYRLSASIGVSFFPDHGEHLDELLVHADSAMYTAKDMTDGSFVIFKKNE